MGPATGTLQPMSEQGRSATTILTRPDGSAVQLLRKASLKVVKGPDKGQRVSLDKDVLTIGADRGCDLTLSDTSVSSVHFEISALRSGFRLSDPGSTNGTFVEGLRVQECLLEGTTTIQVGRTKIRFTPSRDNVEIPLSSGQCFGDMLGESPAMRRVFAILERVAATEATVLLEGESGTGKEVAAHSIHAASPRATEPFIVVDCGAIPESLVESELFGHEKGAFTGADQPRAGSFEAASNGTIFLDEIGELPLVVQPKLLRILESREIKRVGSNASRQVDVRILAATNRDLAAEVEAGRFREDLYYRLAVVRVELPPLRRRREDIVPLSKHFVRRMDPGGALGQGFDDRTAAMLLRHDWPGNVRELRNVVERLLVLPELGPSALTGPKCASEEQGSAVDAGHLLGLPFHDARTQWTEQFERTYLKAKLDEAEGVVLRAAEKAQIPRQTFHRLMRKHGL